ncbi:MAG: 2-oxoacid:acceptor oxidoreductase family protein [bacterium]|nr:2-oxoacid:acceptor oxidoreductase family protein [bacterium]
MDNLTEIRWHGRGGQGAKTAALLFGEAAMSLGQHIQAFPEYGPERMGAPVQSFNRISPEPITLHCGVTNPDIVVVLDPTLIATVDVFQGLDKGDSIIINTEKAPGEIEEELNIKGMGIKIYTVDASGISKAEIGRDIPNTPMLGALVKIYGKLNIEHVLEDMKKKLEKKFRSKPEVIDGNIRAIKRAYEEVKS